MDLVMCFSSCFLDFRLEYRANHRTTDSTDVDDAEETQLDADMLPLVGQALASADIPYSQTQGQTTDPQTDPAIIGVLAGVAGFLAGAVIASLVAYWSMVRRTPPPPPPSHKTYTNEV
jgi:hypothetical protein